MKDYEDGLVYGGTPIDPNTTARMKESSKELQRVSPYTVNRVIADIGGIRSLEEMVEYLGDTLVHFNINFEGSRGYVYSSLVIADVIQENIEEPYVLLYDRVCAFPRSCGLRDKTIEILEKMIGDEK